MQHGSSTKIVEILQGYFKYPRKCLYCLLSIRETCLCLCAPLEALSEHEGNECLPQQSKTCGDTSVTFQSGFLKDLHCVELASIRSCDLPHKEHLISRKTASETDKISNSLF
jgi:hypothetical protein